MKFFTLSLLLLSSVYSIDSEENDDLPTESSSYKTGTIIGGVLSTILGVLIIGGLVVTVKKRRDEYKKEVHRRYIRNGIRLKLPYPLPHREPIIIRGGDLSCV